MNAPTEAEWLAAIIDADLRWLAAFYGNKNGVQATRARYVLFGLWPLIEKMRNAQ